VTVLKKKKIVDPGSISIKSVSHKKKSIYQMSVLSYSYAYLTFECNIQHCLII